ncbi:hypothetical protein [Sinomonas sp. G460-2]|uniref:hypothetical protein n=1 Tax=Sinomonas sp. G460-2 TaxID=3393464 RepID=UPI0039EF7F67
MLLCDDNENWEVLEAQLRSERIKRLAGLADLEEWFIQGTTAALLPYLVSLSAHPDDEDDGDESSAHGEDDDSGYGPDSYYARAMDSGHDRPTA